jgi:enoyl-CoA hydratase/carnithine racemase
VPDPMTSFVPDEPLESYAERFAEHFVLSRTDDGILEVHMHTRGGEAVWSSELHRAIGQLFAAVGNDRENEVMIFTGTGEHWLDELDAPSFAAIEDDEEVIKRRSYDVWYRDGMRLMENLVYDIDIPTIAVVNGPGFHTEFALMCDLTLCSDDAYFIEPHLHIGLAPGDGQYMVFQKLLGVKRANYAMYFSKRLDAQKALDWGLVNEVLPREELLPRARALASRIMENDPTLRRITNHIVKRPWRKLLAEDLEFHFSHEMWQSLVHRQPHGFNPERNAKPR